MSKKNKSDSNNIQSFFNTNQMNSSWQSKDSDSNKKDACNNDWNSVPRTYDKDESMKKHEKSASNNQWTSTSK